MMYEVKQFILNNGEEVLCEVIEWPEEGTKEIVIKNAMSIALSTNGRDNYYTFKPWVHYVEGPREYIIVNTDHIIATANPNSLLLTQYQRAVADMHVTSKERDVEFYAQAKEGMKRMHEIINSLYIKDLSDSDLPSNVIKFPSP